MKNKPQGNIQAKGGEILLYRSKSSGPVLDVRLERETIWLNAHQMAVLFKRDRSVVLKHINEIYRSHELDRRSTCAKNAQVAADGRP